MTPEFQRGFDDAADGRKIAAGQSGAYIAGFAKGANYAAQLKKHRQKRITTSVELYHGLWHWSVSNNGVAILTGTADNARDADLAAQAAAEKERK